MTSAGFVSRSLLGLVLFLAVTQAQTSDPATHGSTDRVRGTEIVEAYKCVFSNGSVVATRFPCDQATLDRFARRLAELLPDLADPLSGDALKDAYVLALAGCDEQTRGRTPEDLGKDGEPFLPWEQLAAMVQAARELFCPDLR